MNIQRLAQSGFAAIAAIFLVVILAALGGFMLTFSNTQQLTSAQDVQGSRAYWAARAGLEWAIGITTASVPVAPATTPPPACSAASTALTIDGVSVTVTCTPSTYTEAGVTLYIFQFGSTASAGGAVGSVGRVERSVSASWAWPS
jgi:MSHA biogenesis protein MshP